MKAFFQSPGFKKILKKLTGEKHASIDQKLRDFDVIWIGGLHSANMIKYFQHKHFHGKMAGFNTRTKFLNEHLYEHVISGNMKIYKYLAMPFSSNFEIADSRYAKDRVTEIRPEHNQIVTERGDIFNYKALVLNTGIDQSSSNYPFLAPLIQDEFAHTRVFVNDIRDTFQVARNTRMFTMHKDKDFIVYLPDLPSRREAYDHLYLALDSYLSKGLFAETHNRGMRIRVVTPSNRLYNFDFANEIALEEISQRSMIDLHFGLKLKNLDVRQEDSGWKRFAYFEDTKTGEEVRLEFGSILITPESKKRGLYEGNDITDEFGQVKVNPYTLQHVKYENIFGFGDCVNVPTTKSLYATLNQGVVVRNNLWDYLHGNEFKAIYEGYTNFHLNHSIDRIWIFKHKYNNEPCDMNFYVPRFLGVFAYKLKNSFEKQYLNKIFQKKANFGYPYLQKDRYFRALNENRYIKEKKITLSEILIHPNTKPVLSFENDGHGNNHGHAHAHAH